MSSVERAECYSQSRGAVDILDGTAQRRPFQFVVIWIGDAQSTYLLVQSVCQLRSTWLLEFKIDRCVVRQQDPFSEWRPAHVCSRQLSFSALSAPGLPR